MLLVCKEEWGLRRGYNAVMSLPVDDMEILESETSVDTGYVIIVKTKSFVLQLHFDVKDDKLAWVKVLALPSRPRLLLHYSLYHGRPQKIFQRGAKPLTL